MKLKNKIRCNDCDMDVISTMGGEFVKCICGGSYVDTDRWDCMSVRIGGNATWNPDVDTYIGWILLKQCNMAKVSFYKLDTSKEGWFQKYKWTEEQQELFKTELIDILKNKKIFKAIGPSYLNNNKKNREKLANEWIFNYGFKTI